VPEKLKDEAYIDAPLPIGQEQTISQPCTVAFMMELLQIEPGDKVLDIGFGSGWTTALLAEIVSHSVIARIRQLAETKQSRELTARSPRLSHIAGFTCDDKNRGKVFAIERIPELCEFGKKNVAKYFPDEEKVEMKCGDGIKGWPENAPFDKIIAGASGEKLPEAWKEQLKIGGRIVAPVKNSIWLFIKKDKNKFEEIEHPGFVFVPLIED